MKQLSAMVLGLIVMNSASANYPLIEMSTSGGLAPSVMVSTKILVLDNGGVFATSKKGSSRESHSFLATLSPEKMANLVRILNQIEPSELVDPFPESHSCADMPSTTIQVFSSPTKSFEIYRSLNCHEFELQGQGARSVVNLMKGLKSLSDLD